MKGSTTITPTTHIAVAGRQIMADQLAIIHHHLPDLQRATSETAVHKTRKAIRRTFTAFKTFAPYDEPQTLDYFRRRLKKVMRRLGRCRDMAVLINKYTAYCQTAAVDQREAAELAQYWRDQLTAAEVSLRAYLARPKTGTLLDDYSTVINTPASFDHTHPSLSPVQVRHVAPLLIHQRLAAVLAFDNYVANAGYAQLHRLRVQFKELRYTLEFFMPLLNDDVHALHGQLNNIQDHLGDLNDAHVAQLLLNQTPGRETAVAAYLAHCREKAVRLEASFPHLWAEFNDPVWRQQLMTAVMAL